MTWSKYESGMRRAFPSGTTFEQTRDGVAIHLQCAEGHEVVEDFNKRMPPDKARKHLTNNGWRFWGTRSRCPEHAKTIRQDKPQETAEVQQPANDTTPTASPNAKTAKRAAFLWLTEVFDENAGRYNDGHSDETVAKEVGLSTAAIIKLREEFGYEIKEPSEIAQWREQANRLEAQIKAVRDGVSQKATDIRADAEVVASKLTRDAEDTTKAILLQINALREKIDQFARRF